MYNFLNYFKNNIFKFLRITNVLLNLTMDRFFVYGFVSNFGLFKCSQCPCLLLAVGLKVFQDNYLI